MWSSLLLTKKRKMIIEGLIESIIIQEYNIIGADQESLRLREKIQIKIPMQIKSIMSLITIGQGNQGQERGKSLLMREVLIIIGIITIIEVETEIEIIIEGKITLEEKEDESLTLYYCSLINKNLKILEIC
jgi:hypothetical protein